MGSFTRFMARLLSTRSLRFVDFSRSSCQEQSPQQVDISPSTPWLPCYRQFLGHAAIEGMLSFRAMDRSKLELRPIANFA